MGRRLSKQSERLDAFVNTHTKESRCPIVTKTAARCDCSKSWLCTPRRLRAEHADPELTVKELADDLCSMDEPRHQARAEELRDRVYDGLNNVAGMNGELPS
jgi:hypothetical protein